MHYFLGIEVVRRTDGFFLHQQKYAHVLLERAGMLNCKPAPTPVDTKAKVSALKGSLASDGAFYHSIVGALQYLTLTRLDLQYAVQQQPTVSHSSAEAEYRAVANAVAECSYIRQLFQELLCDVHKATLVYCDNVSAVYLSANLVHHRWTKHIELDIHFVRKQVALGRVRVLHVPTTQQFADVMTKGLPTPVFEEFRNLVFDLPPVTWVIFDMEHVLYAAKEMGLPCVTLWTMSACAFLAFHQCQSLVDMGIVPLKEAEHLKNGYLDNTVLDSVPGMPKDVRVRDFPSFIRTTDLDDAMLKTLLRSMACYRTTPSAMIFNTFDDIDHEAIAEMSTSLPPIYAVGPLPQLLGQVSGSVVDTLESNLSKENNSFLEWLNANSRQEFLWVIRNDQVNNGDGNAPASILPPEFLEETEERSYVTSWCPQEEVLQDEAVGAFLTHFGWNSVLESMSTGVPMFCWPFGADQFTNKRYVCSEWRVGLEISDNVERNEVKEAIIEMMEGDKGKELKTVAMEWKEKSTVAALPGGSSWVNLEKVVNEVLLVTPTKRVTEYE
ncbi:7-deoxyloganetin glucosyltransferase-like [Aegilops tauschii subsp. strangulata]|uniref:Cytokinin-O-glucosyltransferase 2 n=1 Tax=Aegilops tauschii TaxID=37682 RepID=M8BWT9_AEGTA